MRSAPLLSSLFPLQDGLDPKAAVERVEQAVESAGADGQPAGAGAEAADGTLDTALETFESAIFLFEPGDFIEISSEDIVGRVEDIWRDGARGARGRDLPDRLRRLVDGLRGHLVDRPDAARPAPEPRRGGRGRQARPGRC
jgi:hypothetical protein